jgi:hypothetical protein
MTGPEVTDPDFSPAKRNCLQIAAVSIVVSPDPGILLLAPDPLYQRFFGAEKSVSRIQARLVLGKMPDLGRLQKLFATRESWTIFSDPRGLWIRFQADTQSDPYWIARFDRQAERVMVYCGRPLLEASNGETKLHDPICYPLDQLLLMYHLAYHDGILAHAAGVELDGRGYVFPGCSGAGKSTVSRLFKAGRAGNLLSDERVALRRFDAGWRVFGTPWAGTEGIGSQGCAPLAGMFFLKHDQENRLCKISADNALERLLPVLSIPWYDPEVMSRLVAQAKQLSAKVPAYELGFKPDSSAFDFFIQSREIFS